MQAGQCVSPMGIEFGEAVYAGAQLGRINVFYHMGL
jgi:hypothetical protein